MEAQASTETRPLPGFTPRQGEGLPLFGKSFNYPPARPNSRIDFQFDRAAFNFRFLPFTLPYPVPFRILGDERKVGPRRTESTRVTCCADAEGQVPALAKPMVTWPAAIRKSEACIDPSP